MRQRAREVALEILHKHRLYKLDPDNVYLHRFATAHSAATFTGWAHNQQPVQSMTLPQLVMQRFNAQDADNADLLGYLSGFYQEGPGADSYDAHNEVALSPQEVLNYFWEIDLQRFQSPYPQLLGLSFRRFSHAGQGQFPEQGPGSAPSNP